MNAHDLKILREHYNNVVAGTKTFEIRKNDRAFQKGDIVFLREWNPILSAYERGPLEFKIGDVYPIDDERVVFSLLSIESD